MPTVPVVGMKVLWATPETPHLTNVLIFQYGREEMDILSTEECPSLWLVTVGRDGEPLRYKWPPNSGPEPEGWQGSVRKLNWIYFRPAEG
jgi:hypothetical protein